MEPKINIIPSEISSISHHFEGPNVHHFNLIKIDEEIDPQESVESTFKTSIESMEQIEREMYFFDNAQAKFDFNKLMLIPK